MVRLNAPGTPGRRLRDQRRHRCGGAVSDAHVVADSNAVAVTVSNADSHSEAVGVTMNRLAAIVALLALFGCAREGVGCALFIAPARIQTVATPAYPEDAKAAGIGGTVVVTVTVRKTGAIAAIALTRSSGNAELDAAAEDGAAASTYSGGLAGCSEGGPEPVTYTAVFDGQTVSVTSIFSTETTK